MSKNWLDNFRVGRLRRVGAERLHVGKDRVEDVLGRLAQMRVRARDEAIVAVLVALRVHRLGDAVAEADDEV